MRYKPNQITGFPEWLPEERIIELRWLDIIRTVFESYGFCSIETPAVEEIKVLLSKGGDTDKEIYKVSRLQEANFDESESRLALHYDLTVPLARYVSQHFGQLVFPFKRYQVQKVWRGEKPQAGRFREFYQCDIDVVNTDNLPIFFDAELASIMFELLTKLNIGEFEICISNRKILEGFLKGLNIDDSTSVIRIIDKLDKIGQSGVAVELSKIGVSELVIDKCLEIAKIQTYDSSFRLKVEALNVNSDLLSTGLDELEFVCNYLRDLPGQSVLIDLSIARGFDYYTGTIYEAKLKNDRSLGSICSGGRYDDLCSSYINKRIPGVGISLGLSRLISKYLKDNSDTFIKKCPTDILVIVGNDATKDASYKTAQILRERGFNVEVYYRVTKLQNQLQYANKKGIKYVWFPSFDEKSQHEVKDMETGIQVQADPIKWMN